MILETRISKQAIVQLQTPLPSPPRPLENGFRLSLRYIRHTVHKIHISPRIEFNPDLSI